MMTAINLGWCEISIFQLMLAIGILGMFLCSYERRSLFKLPGWRCGVFVVLLTGVGVVGSMLLYYLETGVFGGVSFYGAVFLIPVIMPLFGFLFQLKLGQTMDICGPCVAIMIGCLRFSCFLTGCCGGWTACIGSICFEWPTQMMDSIGDFAIMTWLLHKESKEPQSGKLYPILMVAYSTMRFFLEFLRDTPKDWMHLSHGQWFAILAAAIGLSWIGILNYRHKVVANHM